MQGARTECGGRWFRRPGFTLLELLVTLAVIATLAALLLPSIARARDQNKFILCQTRLHSLNLATLMYAQDNNSYLPISQTLDNPHTRLIAALDSRKYSVTAQSYYCPSETDALRVYSSENFQAGNIGFFYFSAEQASTNRLLSTFLRWHVAWPRRLKDTDPSHSWVASDSWFSGQPSAHRYYRKGVNYVTLGGNVQSITDGPRRYFR